MSTPNMSATQSLVLGVLIRIAAALLAALLLGSLLAGGGWTLPMDATTAAIFTA
jgi:hypothetical protein